MKKNLLTSLIFVVAMMQMSSTANAQTSLLYYWTFNILDTTITNPHTPQYTRPAADSASIFYYYGTAGYIDFTNPGTNMNAQTPDTSAGWSLRLRTPGDSMIFKMPTTHFTNINFSYATERSGSGPSPVFIYYTTDGTTFKPTCLADATDSCVYSPDVNWGVRTYNFSGDAATANNPNFAIKISYGAWTGGGNNRFDNVALKADTLSLSLGVSNVAETTTSYAVVPNPGTNGVVIRSMNSGAKNIVFRNILGQQFLSVSATGTEVPVNVANLAGGIYFISIQELTSGETGTVKFIKQ